MNLPEPQTLDNACTLWRYHCLNETIPDGMSDFDLIVGLGTYDLRVAQKCAQLYHEEFSRRIIFTGGKGALTGKIFNTSEAEAYAKEARRNGVRKSHISLDTKASNTGENIAFVKKMYPRVKTVIFVTTTQMQRRCRATVDQVWPELEASYVTSPDLHLISQATEAVDLDMVIHEVVGNYARIRTYPERGFQTEQTFCAEVDQAFQELVKRGYTQHMPDNWQEDMAQLA